jgi:hypothetical protein
VFVSFVVAGMIAGAVATLSPMISAFALFTVPAIIPIVLQFLMRGGEINPTELVAAIINQKDSFEEGIRSVGEMIRGSCSLLILTDDAVFRFGNGAPARGRDAVREAVAQFFAGARA